MPGRMLLVDTQLGQVIKDEELKHNISTLRPVSEWLKSGLLTLKDIHHAHNKVKGLPQGTISLTRTDSVEISVHYDRRLPTFGYSVEDISMLVLPMIRNRFVEMHYKKVPYGFSSDITLLSAFIFLLPAKLGGY